MCQCSNPEAENHSATSEIQMRTNPLYSKKKLWTIVKYPSYLKIPLGLKCSLTYEARDGALYLLVDLKIKISSAGCQHGLAFGFD